MTTTVTTNEFVRRVYDALNDQDPDAFTALCADDFQFRCDDKGCRDVDAVNQNSTVASHCEIARQRRGRHVSQ